MTEVELPEAGPRQGGGVVAPAPDDHVVELRHLAPLDDQHSQLPTQALQACHQVQWDLLQLKDTKAKRQTLRGRGIGSR